jgi:hypothetical protein
MQLHFNTLARVNLFLNIYLAVDKIIFPRQNINISPSNPLRQCVLKIRQLL